MAPGLDCQLPAFLPVRSSQKPASEPPSPGLPPSQVADLSSPHWLLRSRRLGRGPPAPFSLPLWGAPPSSLGSSTLSAASPDLLILLQPPTLPPLGPPPPSPGPKPSYPSLSPPFLDIGFWIPGGPHYPSPKSKLHRPSILGRRALSFRGPLLRLTAGPYRARALPPHPGPPPSRIRPAPSPVPTVSEVRTLRLWLPRSGTLGPRTPGFLRPKRPSIAHCPPNSGVRSRASHPQEPVSPV